LLGYIVVIDWSSSFGVFRITFSTETDSSLLFFVGRVDVPLFVIISSSLMLSFYFDFFLPLAFVFLFI